MFVLAFAVGLAATLWVVRVRPPGEIAQGEVFSTRAGDPVDVVYGREGRRLSCMNVGATYYPPNVSCADPADVEKAGTWVLVLPEVKARPPLVVGIVPSGASTATVHVRSTSVEADMRGRWFVASLPARVLGPRNDVPFAVGFGG